MSNLDNFSAVWSHPRFVSVTHIGDKRYEGTYIERGDRFCTSQGSLVYVLNELAKVLA